MKSILSFLTLFALFAVATLAEEEETLSPCEIEVNTYKRDIIKTQREIKKCEETGRMHERKMQDFENNNHRLTNSMKKMNKDDEREKASQKVNQDPKAMAAQKKKLIAKMNDIEEDMYEKEEAYDEEEMGLKKQIKALQEEIDSLKEEKEL